MNCSYCGKSQFPGQTFCSGCGRRMEPESAAPASSPDPDPDPRYARLEARVRALEQRLPHSHIINRSFWARAFTVLGHQLAATLTLYLALFLVVGLGVLVVALLRGMAR